MDIKMSHKKWALRVAAGAAGVYAIFREPLAGTFESTIVGPITLSMVAGIGTLIFVYGHWKRKW